MTVTNMICHKYKLALILGLHKIRNKDEKQEEEQKQEYSEDQETEGENWLHT